MGYEKLTSREKEFYIQKIESILDSEKPFVKNDFSLPKLARQTGISLHIISYLVNVEMNLHFTEYINLMRIEYFMAMIKDGQWTDWPIQKMSEACGFKSRTTFYRVCVKYMGMGPSAYLGSKRE